ncbi:hypothetical protein TrCOL_g9398 [Triparma columacea]|uniref:Uncharacterized protein n=1 Tax=Triparma columacea TaxID=722753 RepID=A0A9W7GNW4_9STRA|nr:hypothetical protein TrCOL_g9398 [Triparma columacea]
MPPLLSLLTIFLLPTLAISLCVPTPNSTTWVWSSPVGLPSYSCQSSAGATNDLGSTPLPCASDPTSVYISLDPALGAECLVAKSDCLIPMATFESLTYQYSISGCAGVWAAPLWLTPDTWQWGGGSGEIDSLEFCPRDGVNMNFAGGGHQITLDDDIDDAWGYVTVRKDVDGIVTSLRCDEGDLVDGMCPEPSYSSCDECMSSPSYACYCDGGSNIYGSGGCQPDTDCMWTLVSDIWNGVSGDDGYFGCMTGIDGVVEKGEPNMKTECKISVEKIVVRGEGGGKMVWGDGSPEYCDLLTLQ